MAKDDFAIGLLQGLYNSGVGNPEVQERRRNQALQEAYYQRAMDNDAMDRGMVRDNTPHPETGNVVSKVMNVLFPGRGGIQEAFPTYKQDPNAMIYGQDSAGKVGLHKGSLPEGVARINDTEKGAALLASQNKPAEPNDNLLWQMLKDKEKQTRETQELQVPGYELSGNVRPTQKEAQDLRTSTAAMADFTKGIDQMIGLIDKHGSTNLFGEASGEMESLAANLKLTLKEVQKLGVLSASDIAFLEAQIFDPSSLKSLKTATPTAIKQLQTAKNRAMSLVNESLKARGFQPKGETSKQADTSKGTAPSSEDQMALEWAKSNPLDPRAQKIIQMNGGR